MYQTDVQSGETIFTHKPAQPAQQVFLVSHDDPATGRVAMKNQNGCWMARIRLRAALFIYRFEVDGRACWDRDAGKVKFSNDKAWSLAVVFPGPLESPAASGAFA